MERLVKAGLVERSTCDDDRRARFVGITAAGARVHDGAKRDYDGLLEKAFSGASSASVRHRAAETVARAADRPQRGMADRVKLGCS